MSKKLDEFPVDILDARFPLTSLEKHLLEIGAVDRVTLRKIQSQAMERGVFVEEELLESGQADEEAVLSFVALKQNVPYIILDDHDPPPEVVTLLDQDFCEKHNVFPLRVEGGYIHIAMSDPKDIMLRDKIRELTGFTARPHLTSKGAIKKKIFQYRQFYR